MNAGISSSDAALGGSKMVGQPQDAALQLGVSFRNLNVHGFTNIVRFQPTVVSYALALPRFIASLISQRAETKVQILQGFDGLIRPGEMLLVLGRPGSGCTTFLKALGGDTCGIFLGEHDSINYQGIPYKQMHSAFKGESVYLAELDVHFPELTLGQTLGFVASIHQLGPNRTPLASKEAHEVAALFALEGAVNTWMGNSMIRGVSGGEKRRTSIAEAMMGGAQLQFWDNSTRGLDSSTAFDFVELLRTTSAQRQTTVALSVYQASEALYERFDKVTVLYEGRQIYFGPIDLAAQYFHELGFRRHPRSTTPDFLTSLTNPAERAIRPGYENRVPRSPDEFAKAWADSPYAAQLLTNINEFNARYPLLGNLKGANVAQDFLHRRTSTYAIPIYLQILSCLQRGIQRLRNQPAAVIGSIVANAILALVVGSVYYNLPENSENLDRRAVMIFFSLLVTAYSPAFEVLTIWAQRPIVEKQDRYAFYHPVADAAASMICDLPNKFLTNLLFQITLYFMTNLKRTAAGFFIWFLFNFVLVLNMSMWFRFIGSISRTMEQSTAPTCIIVLLSCIYTGFVVPVPYMVGWLKWFRFVNPIAYTYESLMINEIGNRQFPCLNMLPGGPSYSNLGLQHKICPVVGAVRGENYVDGNAYLAQKYSYVPGHLWRNLGIVIAMTIIVCAFHLLAAEYVPAERSKGDLLRYHKSPRWRKILGGDSEEAPKPVDFAQDATKVENGTLVKQEQSETYTAPIIQQQLSVFHWRDLNYDVKLSKNNTKRILSNIEGWVKPGTITALMGVTGAGKTTLLDVLANRASFGTVSGKINIDGDERDAGFQRRIGYAQQEDIHLPTATVREALEFSALLRQSNRDSGEKLAYVNNVIEVLNMASYADAVVGVPGDGLNIEQRKRLTVGVELVARPDLLLFLDEPTSGLDSQTAWSICTLLRKLANNGQGILCTIHQPSSEIFCMFDRLLLLNNQGQTIFFGDIGEDASALISYFEENGASKCKPGSNPAEWALRESSKVPSMVSTDTTSHEYWANKWEVSEQRKEVIRNLNTFNELHHSANQASAQDEYAASWLQQVMVVTKRIFQEYWRSPTYLYSKLALCAGVALFNGLSFQNSPLDTQGLQNVIFSMFLLTQMFGTVDQQVIPRFVDGRSLFEARESRSKSYSWTVFLTSNIVVEAAWQTVAAVLVFIAWYYPTGLWRNSDSEFGTVERGALSYIIIWLYCLWISTFSQMVAAPIEHAESSIQLSTLMFWFSLVFCGVMVFPTDLPNFWKFVWRASPLTYLIGGLSIAGLSKTNITCSGVQAFLISQPDEVLSCGEYLAPYVQMAGGRVQNPEVISSNCTYCPIAEADGFLYDKMQVPGGSPWNNAGYFTVFIIFNVLVTFWFYWLARVPRRT